MTVNFLISNHGKNSVTGGHTNRTFANLPPSSGGGGFSTPNIINNESFETGFGQFKNTDLSSPPTGVSRDNTLAFDGSWSLKRTWTTPQAGDVGSACIAVLGGSFDHVWVRFYLRLTANITSHFKFSRFYDAGLNTNFGGIFIGAGSIILEWGFDQEDGAITVGIGVNEAQVLDGNWHSVEYEYWRNGAPSGFPEAAFWFDGNSVSMPDGNVGFNMNWSGGRLSAGERSSSVKMANMEWMGTLNGGNTTAGQANIDKVAVSSLGRIGP